MTIIFVLNVVMILVGSVSLIITIALIVAQRWKGRERMKLLIEIPEEVKQAFDYAESNDLKDGYYDHGGVIGKAIKNGTPLDTVLDEIMAEIPKLVCCENEYRQALVKVADVIKCIDKYRAESEDKECQEKKH